MNKLNRTVDRTLNTLTEPVVYHVGNDEELQTYLNDNNVDRFYDGDDGNPEVIVFAGDEIDTNAVKYFDQASVVIVKENEGGSLRKRNTSHIHNNAFGDLIYLDDDGPHVIVYSRNPEVIEEVGKPVEPTTYSNRQYTISPVVPTAEHLVRLDGAEIMNRLKNETAEDWGDGLSDDEVVDALEEILKEDDDQDE